MSTLIFAETWEGHFKKATYEAVSYGAKVAQMQGSEAVAVVLGSCHDDLSVLGKYGAQKVLHLASESLNHFNPKNHALAINEVANSLGALAVVVSGTFNGKSIVPALAIALKASPITNICALPDSVRPLRVKRSAFSSKGYVVFESQLEKSILSIIPNGIGVHEIPASPEVSSFDFQPASSNTQLVSVDRAKGSIPLPEAEIVVSGGRGLKGPENWKMLEELAEVLGAGTACSKPVSDMHWRPHSEHVGQTGIAINPNLYIAVGISGAIQHLAGVSNSKTIVVINSDSEAPFFKAADYGIVGDAFDVVPKLTAAIKNFKAQN